MVLILAPCGLGLFVTAVIIFIAVRSGPEPEGGDFHLALIGAAIGVFILFLARSVLESLLRPDSFEFDVLFYYVLPPFFGSFLGAATALMGPLLGNGRRAAARNMLLVVSLVVFSLCGWLLYDLIVRPDESLTGNWQNDLFWLSDPLLPMLWVIGLWAWWGLSLKRSVSA